MKAIRPSLTLPAACMASSCHIGWRSLWCMRPSVDDPHEAMFGFRPSGLGKSYERPATIVFADLVWTDVVFDTIRGVPGRRAKHQIDVTARRSDGSTRGFLTRGSGGESHQQRPTLVAAYCAWAAVYWSPADDESCWMSPWQENDVVCR